MLLSKKIRNVLFKLKQVSFNVLLCMWFADLMYLIFYFFIIYYSIKNLCINYSLIRNAMKHAKGSVPSTSSNTICMSHFIKCVYSSFCWVVKIDNFWFFVFASTFFWPCIVETKTTGLFFFGVKETVVLLMKAN